MKLNKGIILFASVSIIGSLALGASTDPKVTVTADQPTVTPAPAPGPTAPVSGPTVISTAVDPAQQELADQKKTCLGYIEKMNDDISAAKKACSNSGNPLSAKDVSKQGQLNEQAACFKKASDCAGIMATGLKSSSEDGQVNATTKMLFQFIGQSNLLDSTGSNPYGDPPPDAAHTKGSCMKQESFDQQRKDIQDELTQAQKDVTDIQSKIADAQSDAAKTASDGQKQLTDLSAQSRQEDMDNMKAQQEQAQSAQKMQIDSKNSISQLNMQILATQGQVADTISKRTQDLLKLTNDMIQKGCLQALEADKQKMGILSSGSSGSLITDNREVQRREALDYNSCIQEGVSLRNQTEQKYQNTLDQLNAQISDSQAQVRSIQSSVSLSNQQVAQQTLANQQNQQQQQVERQSNYTTIQQNNLSQSSTSQQKINGLNQSLTQATDRVNRASAELALIGTSSAGTQAPTDAQDALSDYEAQVQSCKLNCLAIDGIVCDGSSKPAGSAPTQDTTGKGTDATPPVKTGN